MHAQKAFNNPQLARTSINAGTCMIDVNPSSRNGYYYRSVGYMFSNEYNKAIKDIDKMLELPAGIGNRKIGNLEFRAKAYVKLKQYDKAIVDADHIIKEDAYLGYSVRATINKIKGDNNALGADIENLTNYCTLNESRCGSKKAEEILNFYAQEVWTNY